MKNVASIVVEACSGLCILGEVSIGNNESVCELWRSVNKRPILSHTMALSWFENICRMLCFVNRPTRMTSLRNNRKAAALQLRDGLVTNTRVG